MRRTQIYLTDRQRRSLDRSARREGVSVAEVIRRAIDAYLSPAAPAPDPSGALRRTFGALPDLEIPDRSEWDRGRG